MGNNILYSNELYSIKNHFFLFTFFSCINLRLYITGKSFFCINKNSIKDILYELKEIVNKLSKNSYNEYIIHITVKHAESLIFKLVDSTDLIPVIIHVDCIRNILYDLSSSQI